MQNIINISHADIDTAQQADGEPKRQGGRGGGGWGGSGGEEETSIDFNTDYWNISHCHQQSNSNSTDLDGHIPPTYDCILGVTID